MLALKAQVEDEEVGSEEVALDLSTSIKPNRYYDGIEMKVTRTIDDVEDCTITITINMVVATSLKGYKQTMLKQEKKAISKMNKKLEAHKSRLDTALSAFLTSSIKYFNKRVSSKRRKEAGETD